MSKNWNDITLSIAGIFQAATLVEQLAQTGFVPNAEFTTSINSLFATNPDNTLAVFGGDPHNVDRGLTAMHDHYMQLNNSKGKDTLRYVLSLLHLEKKLHGRKDMLTVIASRIEQAQAQANHFDTTHDNVIANLAAIYSDTLSTFRFRIQVMGNYTYLQQERTANQIRALLLAGIRSCILWRQVGGSRLHLVTSRKRMAAIAEDIRRTPFNSPR